MVRLGHPEVGPLSCGQVWHRFIFESVASPFCSLISLRFAGKIIDKFFLMGKTCWMVRLGHPEVGPLSCGQVWHRFIFESVASPFCSLIFPAFCRENHREFVLETGKVTG